MVAQRLSGHHSAGLGLWGGSRETAALKMREAELRAFGGLGAQPPAGW